MSSIDERIVDMKFNNSQFEQKIRTTLGSLDNLKKGLNLSAATKGVQELHAAGNRFNLSGMASGVAGLGTKLTAMGVVGVTALANIANRAVNAGITLVKSLTIDPIKTGLEEYETQLNAVQTILANTQAKGGNLKTVNAALQELNNYSDKTIYNFSEMARNIGTFTAAGVGLKTSTEAIKGIANLAAMSGSNAQQASTAMYQLSQALSTGTVKLQDWNSVVNAGMGGEVFQEALKSTARNHGVAVDDIIKKQGSFRNSLQKGWLTSKILTETLSKFTGDLSAEQLKSMGYNDKEIVKIMKQAKTAQDAATKVKTMTQLIGTLKESAQSGWSQTWQIIFGDFEEAKKLFTNINNVLGGMIQDSSDARNDLLKGWDKLGGRTVLIDAIAIAFKNVMKVVKVVGKAFENVFPPATKQDLLSLSLMVKTFAMSLKMGKYELINLQLTFQGFFALLSIGWQLISKVAGVIGDLLGVVSGGSGGFLEWTSAIGVWLVNLDKAMKRGDDLSVYFGNLGQIIKIPMNLIKTFGEFIASMFDNIKGVDTSGFADNLKASFEPLGHLAGWLGAAWAAMSDALGKVWAFVQPVVNALGTAFAWVGGKIQEAMSKMSLENLTQIGGLGVLTAIGLAIKGFFDSLKGAVGGGSGMVDSIRGVFDAIKEKLNPTVEASKPKSMLLMAGAIALLALSLYALSSVDTEGLLKGVIAMGILFKMLESAMASFKELSATGTNKGMITLGIALVLLAVGVRVLAGAVVKMAGVDFEGLMKGLIGLTVVLRTLSTFMENITISKGAMANAAALVILAVAVNLLAGAMKVFATMSWEELAKGGAALAAVLGIIAGALNIMPKDMPQIAGSMMAIAVSMAILSGVFKVFATMSWEDIGKAGTVLAGALTIIAGAMWLFPVNLAGIAMALLAVSVSMLILSGVFKIFASMSWEDIAKAGVVLAGALLIIAGGMYLMTAALPGAAALLIVAAALAVLAPVLLLFGSMSWESIGASMAMLASTLGILAIGGILLIPALVGFIGLGLAILLIGAGVMLAGQGLIAFSQGLLLLASAGAAGSAAVVLMVTTMIGLIPGILIAIGYGIIGIINVIAQSGSAFVAAAVTLIMSLLIAIDTVAPKAIDTLMNLIDKLLSALVKNTEKFVNAGMKVLKGFLKGIGDNISDVVAEGLRIVSEFIKGVGKGLPGVIEEAANLIITFVKSLASTVRSKSAELGAAGGDLAAALVEGMVKGTLSGVNSIVDAARRMAQSVIDTIKKVLNIHSPSKATEELGAYAGEGFYNGLTGAIAPVIKRVTATINEMKDKVKAAIEDSNKEIAELGAKLKKQQKDKKKSKKDKKAITATKKELAAAKDERNKELAAQEYLTLHMQAEETRLTYLSDQYDIVTDDLVKRTQELTDAQTAQANALKSFTDQYSALPEFANEGDLVNQYLDSMQTQIEATTKFAADLAQLRKMNLDDTTYQKLLSKGLAAQPFISALLESGQIGIDEINRLDKDVASAAGDLGATASSELYQAGVDAARGLVVGLQSQQAAIAAEMDTIAQAMVTAIKSALGIHSPSKEFATVGGYAASGLMEGMQKMLPAIAKSSESLGDLALDAIKSSMDSVSDMVFSDMDMNPTIRPVLDLSDIKKGSDTLNGLFKAKEIGVNTSYSRASSIALAERARQEEAAMAETAPVSTGDTVNFVQNNNSPKALSNSEIYRQTRNGLSVAKGGLPK